MGLVHIKDVGLVHTSVFGNVKRPPKSTGDWADVWRRRAMKDVMVDLETLGTVPGCVLLSIGAVAFNPRNGDVDEQGFYTAIKISGQEDAGLHICPRTQAWWDDQSPEARKVFDDPGAQLLGEALLAFNRYLYNFGADVRLWGNGADFDNALLSAAYRAANVSPHVKPYNGRCYRTLKNLAPHIKMEKRHGTHHNALDDARSQAAHLLRIIEGTTLTIA